MPRDRLVLIYDAYTAAQRITRYLQGKSFADYDADDLLQSAVERQFEIIGEALNVARMNDSLLEFAITDLAGIVKNAISSPMPTTRSSTQSSGTRRRTTCLCSSKS